MQIPSNPLSRGAVAALSVAGTLTLAGCYVVPVHPTHSPYPAPAAVPVPAPPAPISFTARLYPSNDAAATHGMVMAVVTNDLNGRGHFSTQIGGEAFTGEATREAGSTRAGTASGSGNRGGFIQCRYTMNSPTLGTGHCRMSSGATFTMHVGG